VAALCAAGSALAGGVLGAVGLARRLPATRLGRVAVATPLLPLVLLPGGGLLVVLGVDAFVAFAPFDVAWPLLTLAALAVGVAGRLRGDVQAVLVVPLAVGLFIAVWTVGEIVGH
jgi:hypothetical protein